MAIETMPNSVLHKQMPIANDIYIRRIFNKVRIGSLRYHARKVIWNGLYKVACLRDGDNVVGDMLFAAYRMGTYDGYTTAYEEMDK